MESRVVGPGRGRTWKFDQVISNWGPDALDWQNLFGPTKNLDKICLRQIFNLSILGALKNSKIFVRPQSVTQTAVINIVNLRIIYKLDVSYASQHTFSKVSRYKFLTTIYIYASDKGSGTEIKKKQSSQWIYKKKQLINKASALVTADVDIESWLKFLNKQAFLLFYNGHQFCLTLEFRNDPTSKCHLWFVNLKVSITWKLFTKYLSSSGSKVVLCRLFPWTFSPFPALVSSSILVLAAFDLICPVTRTCTGTVWHDGCAFGRFAEGCTNWTALGPGDAAGIY